MRNRTSFRSDRYPFFIPLFFGLFEIFGSYPRMLIEVFVRKNFGRRYFYLWKCLILAAILGYLPYWQFTRVRGWSDIPPDIWFFRTFIAWYAYLGLFVIFSLRRWWEIDHSPGAIDTKRSSRYMGEINMFFWTFGRSATKRRLKEGNLSEEEFSKLKFNSARLIECLLEPLPFFIAGIILIFCIQWWGFVLCICSLFYSFGHISLYMRADDDLQDEVDEMRAKTEREDEKKEIMRTLGLQTKARERAPEDPLENQANAPAKVS